MEKFGFKEKVSRKKGFTLVELLVVLVIMAVLAAAIIPSMMGFIDKTRESVVLPNARVAYQAAKVQANEAYGIGNGTKNASGDPVYGIFGGDTGAYSSRTAVFFSQNGTTGGNIKSAVKMADIADISSDYVCWVHFTAEGKGKIDAVLYAQNDYVAYYHVDNNSWEIVKDELKKVLPQTSGYVYFWDVYKAYFPEA